MLFKPLIAAALMRHTARRSEDLLHLFTGSEKLLINVTTNE